MLTRQFPTSKMRGYAALGLLLTLSYAAPAEAQISYGVKAGVNFANVAIAPDEGSSPSRRVGALAGVFATVPVAWGLTLQPEAIYTAKGASIEFEGFETNYIVDYIEVPVLARFRVLRSAYVLAGPSMAFRLRARNRVPFGGSVEEVDLDGEVETFDLGIVGAIGVDIGRWLVDARYTHGVSDTDRDTSDDVTIRNRVFSLSAGFRF